MHRKSIQLLASTQIILKGIDTSLTFKRCSVEPTYASFYSGPTTHAPTLSSQTRMGHKLSLVPGGLSGKEEVPDESEKLI